MNGLIETMSKVYEWLADEQSRDIYMNRLNYLISGDFKYIMNILESYSSELLEDSRKRVDDILTSISGDNSFVLYGAGGDARLWIPYFLKNSRFVGLCDSDKEKQGRELCGIKVSDPQRILMGFEGSVIISSHLWEKEIKENIEKMGIPENRILSLGWYIRSAHEDQYFRPEFMTYEDEEVFVDAGCYDLQSTIMLKGFCKKLKAYCLEPDREMYKKCTEIREKHTKDITIELIPKGAWSCNDTLSFNNTADACSHISDAGDVSIDVSPIDEIIPTNEKVTFIKMDIEGAELEALKGASNTIMRCKPKLAICIYHKPEDMYRIPEYIKELNDNYRFYIRHHANTPSETVLYALP